VATLAAIEAFRTVGGETLFAELKYIHAQARAIGLASRADDDTDADGNGIADVDEIPPHELLKRKCHVALVAINEPNRLQVAVGSLWAAYLAVLASLKLQFVRTVSIALGIAECVKLPATRFFAPLVAVVLGSKLKHWASFVVTTIINLLAMLIAWYLQMVISAFYSGLRGARIFSVAFVTFLAETALPRLPADFPEWLLCGIKREAFDPNDTYVDEALGAVVFVAGFCFQILSGFNLPFPLNLLLLPVSIVEQFLRWQITYFSNESSAAALQG